MPFLIIKENAARIHAEPAPEFDEIYRGMDRTFRRKKYFYKKKYLYDMHMEYLRQAAAVWQEPAVLRIYPGDGQGRMGQKSFRAAIAAVHDFLAEYDRMVYIVLEDKGEIPAAPKHFRAVAKYLDKYYIPQPAAIFKECRNCLPFSAARSLDDLMEHMGETFSQMLFRLIDERKLKDSDVYRRANIDRRHFSKIRNDKDYNPNKRTVLAFAIALELSLDETKDLLMRAGFAFSNSSKSDVIIRYYIEKKNYNIFEINEMLFAYGQPLLG